jgi:VIT1/CCC1 family predicted Fe2+/Mn2+ transporter
MAKKRVHRPDGSRPIPASPPKPATARASASPGSRLSLRERFEDASRPVLRRMQSLPAFLIPVTLGILLFLGLTLNAAWSGMMLILIAAFLFWLTAVSWPAISPGSRILRLVVDVGVLALGVLKVLGRL